MSATWNPSQTAKGQGQTRRRFSLSQSSLRNFLQPGCLRGQKCQNKQNKTIKYEVITWSSIKYNKHLVWPGPAWQRPPIAQRHSGLSCSSHPPAFCSSRARWRKEAGSVLQLVQSRNRGEIFYVSRNISSPLPLHHLWNEGPVYFTCLGLSPLSWKDKEDQGFKNMIFQCSKKILQLTEYLLCSGNSANFFIYVISFCFQNSPSYWYYPYFIDEKTEA